MNLKNFLLLVSRLFFVTLSMPFWIGLLLLAVMMVNSFFGYLNGTCISVDECFVVRVVYEVQQPKFWRFILAMWACNLFVVVVAIFFKWRKK